MAKSNINSVYVLRRILVPSLIFSANSILISQTHHLDSLNTLLKSAKEDTSKANLLNELARSYLFELNDINKLEYYAAQQLKLAQKLNFKKGMAYGLMNIGISKRSRGDYKEAVQFAGRSLNMMKEIDDKKGEASCYINLGLGYSDMGNFQPAVDYTLKGIILKEKLNDKRGVAAGYNNLGNIFYDQKNLKASLKYHLNSLKIHEELNDKLGVSMSYNNIGIVYYSMEKMDDAMTYFKKAIKMSEELDDKMGIADTYNNMGNIYLKKNLIDEAFACQLKSLKVAELNNDKKAIAIAYNSIGNIYEKKKNYQLAISNYTKSVDLSAEIDVKQGMMEGYKNLVSVYKQLKNSEEALYYLNLYYNLNDSLLNKENFKQLAVLSTQYETEKKENEILLLTKDKELNAKIIRQQKLVRWGLIGGFILLCISVFSIYRRYRYKQRANVILEKQKQVIEEKNILITDSINYAQTIQEAVLPTEEEVEKLFPEFFVLYKPKAIVSGDFYWVNKTNDKHICAVADCTGHGVPGAFMSLLGYNMLENIVKQAKDCKPGTILDLLNAELIARLSAMEGEETVKHGMDISIISMDVKSNKMEFAGAHNPVYIIRDNELIELKADKRGMGTAHTTPFSNQEIEIKKGDMIYLFTDGFPDQIGGPKRKKFYYQPFKEVLISISREQMNIQKQQLDEIHEQWLFGKYDQTDDILIMGIRY